MHSLSDKTLHPMSYPTDNSAEDLFIVDRGEGCYIFDSNGEKYLDAQAGLWCVNIGHNSYALNRAILTQASKIAYYNTFEKFANVPCLELAEKIIEHLQPEGMARVFFSSGGSDAVDTALKLSRNFWTMQGSVGKSKLLSFSHGYHGLHFGGVSVGAKIFQDGFGPIVPGCIAIESPGSYELNDVDQANRLYQAVIANIEATIKEEGADTIAALIVEPVQGVGGVVVPPAELWPALRDVCDRHNILLIADEVITGFGRSGCMFGVRHWNVKPDIMCLAKGLTSGYIPLGATVINQKIVDAFKYGDEKMPLIHGYTYSGHPLACAVALANIEEVARLNLDEMAKEMGSYFMYQLMELSKKWSMLGEIRGLGLMIAIDLVNPYDKTQNLIEDDDLVIRLRNAIFERKLIVRFIGATIVLSPPLIITKHQIDDAVSILDKSIASVSC